MLSPVQEDILVDLLVHGDDGPRNIAENTDRNPDSVSQRLPELVEQDFIRNKGAGTYTLTRDGIHLAREIIHEREKDQRQN